MTHYNEVLELLKQKSTSTVFSIHNYENKKKHDIDVSNVIHFFKNYCDSLYMKDLTKWNKKPVLALGEITKSCIPVIGEFLFRFDLENIGDVDSEPLYEKELFLTIVKVYQDTIKEIFFISSEKSELICCVSESSNWKENSRLNVKLKIQFPYCRADKKFLNTVFKSKILQNLRQSKASNFFTKSSPLGDWDSQLEEIKETYPLYGSTDNMKRPPCYFIGSYSEKGKEIAINNAYDFMNHSFISNGSCISDQVEVLEDGDMNPQELNMYLLPLFLSMDYISGLNHIKDEYNPGGTSRSGSVIMSEETDFEYENENPDDFTICLELVEMLSETRFNEEVYFLDIGKALYKASGGDEDGLNEWTRIAETKSQEFDRNFCESTYDNFDQEHTSVKTIAWYARIDSKDKYEDWHEAWCRPKLLRALDAKHVTVAEAFYRVFWLDYMFSGRKWIEFRKSRLTILEEDFSIRRKITNFFIPCFDRVRSQISEEKLRQNRSLIGKSQTSREKVSELEKQITDVGKLIEKLLTETFRGPLIRSLKEYFYKENLTKILNKNPNLLGAGNFIIELLDKRAISRPGKPEDFITKRLGVTYKSEYSYKHPDVIELLRYFEQVFPEPSINHHMKKDLASLLYGRNAEKYFRVWIGDTNGSKSVYQKMLRIMMGDYYCDLPATYFSAQQRGGSGPNPELAQTEGSRVAFSAEPDDDMSFKGARIKRLTGGDSFYARSCNEDGGTIETTFKNIMVLNLVPNVDGIDEATKNRFLFTPFEGRWVRAGEKFQVAETHEEQVKAKTYRMDERFEDNIPKLASALLWLAVESYKTYREEGLEPPRYIKDWMADYWKKHDPHISFITEMLENPKTKDGDIDMGKYVTATDVYPIYKKWWKETYPQSQVLPKPRMIEILSTPDKLRKQRDRRWYGVIVRRQAPPEIAEF